MHKEFYGSTTVGEKGQIVVPAEARKVMGLKKGDKLLVFGMGSDMIAFSKISHMEKMVSHLTQKLETIRTAIKKSGVKKTGASK